MRRAVLLLVVFAAVTLISRVLVYGVLTLDAMTAAVIVAVPLAQAACLAGADRVRNRRRRT